MAWAGSGKMPAFALRRAQDAADGLDPERILHLVGEGDHLVVGRPGAGIDLEPAAPLARCLRCHPQLGSDMTDGRVLGQIILKRFLQHPERTLAELGRELTGMTPSS